MTIAVTLTLSEALHAGDAGLMRAFENIQLGRRAAYGAAVKGSEFDMHIEGALGERAVAKAFNLYWPGKGSFRGADVGVNVQVRSSRGGACLILHPDDPDEALFYFARREPDSLRFTVAGPLVGARGKQAQFWREDVPSPAFFVPLDKVDWGVA